MIVQGVRLAQRAQACWNTARSLHRPDSLRYREIRARSRGLTNYSGQGGASKDAGVERISGRCDTLSPTVLRLSGSLPR